MTLAEWAGTDRAVRKGQHLGRHSEFDSAERAEMTRLATLALPWFLGTAALHVSVARQLHKEGGGVGAEQVGIEGRDAIEVFPRIGWPADDAHAP